MDCYRKDIADGADAITKWVGRVKYYRFPFLHQGPTEAKYRVISEFLKSDSYVNLPVTIDNDDWLYNREYTTALKDRDSIRADSIGREYLTHMQAKVLYFDSLAIEITSAAVQRFLQLRGDTRQGKVFQVHLIRCH